MNKVLLALLEYVLPSYYAFNSCYVTPTHSVNEVYTFVAIIGLLEVLRYMNVRSLYYSGQHVTLSPRLKLLAGNIIIGAAVGITMGMLTRVLISNCVTSIYECRYKSIMRSL